MDYMTYNARVLHVMVEAAQNMGWSANNVAAARQSSSTPGPVSPASSAPTSGPLANPNDRINLDACLPRFQLAVHDFGSDVFLNVVKSGTQAGYYEPQLLGPIALTTDRALTAPSRVTSRPSPCLPRRRARRRRASQREHDEQVEHQHAEVREAARQR